VRPSVVRKGSGEVHGRRRRFRAERISTGELAGNCRRVICTIGSPAMLTSPIIIQTLALVDNDDDDVFFLRRTLRQANIGTEVIRLHGGREAIGYIGRTGPYADWVRYPPAQLIFLDIQMPRCSGFDVLIWLQARPDLPRPFIAILSGSELPEDKARATHLGADGYLSKPPSPQYLHEFARAHHFEWLTAR